MSIKSYVVATDNKTVANSLCESNSDSGDESKNDDESLQETYKKIYIQWIKMCATNRALGSENQELCNLKNKEEGKVQQLDVVIVEEEEKLKFVATELERTQKALRLLNNGTSRLDHLIISGKLFGDNSGAGFKGEYFGTKIVFINLDYLLNLLTS